MTIAPRKNDLYVGYRGDNSTSQARFTRRTITLLLIVVGTVAAVLSFSVGAFDPGVFEFGQERTIAGVVHAWPQPRLVVDDPIQRPDGVTSGPPYTELLLVGLGKHGAHESLAGLDGQSVLARGTLIARGSDAMLELSGTPQKGALQKGGLQKGPKTQLAESSPVTALPQRGREVILVGEIVDSKCFLGVMKPGRGKSHRSCAALCLAGGIPPAFLVRGEKGPEGSNPNEWLAYLLDTRGQPIEQSLAPLVGETIRLSGRLLESDKLSTPRLLIDPASLERL